MFYHLSEADTILIHLPRSPGDTIVLAETIRVLKQDFPQYRWAVSATAGKDIFKGNPDVVPKGGKIHRITPDLPFHLSEQHKTPRFCELLYHEITEKMFGTGIWKTIRGRPFLYLTDEEKRYRFVDRKYVVVVCGGKRDTPVKIVPKHVMQPVVDWLGDHGFEAVQIGSRQDIHHPLDHAINLLGYTNLRQLFGVVYNAEAVVSGITLVHHVAGALGIPSVTVCGGRERTELTEYATSIMLKADDLDCCRDKGCWKYDWSSSPQGCENKMELSTPGVIHLPVHREYYPKCMDEIGPDVITKALEIVLL